MGIFMGHVSFREGKLDLSYMTFSPTKNQFEVHFTKAWRNSHIPGALSFDANSFATEQPMVEENVRNVVSCVGVVW